MAEMWRAEECLWSSEMLYADPLSLHMDYVWLFPQNSGSWLLLSSFTKTMKGIPLIPGKLPHLNLKSLSQRYKISTVKKIFENICNMCVINLFYSVPKSRSMVLDEAQQAARLWQTQPMESSIQIVSGRQILNNWKEGLLMENVRNSYAWLPSPSKLLTFLYLKSVCVCMHVCIYIFIYIQTATTKTILLREHCCCKTPSLLNNFCLGFPAQHSLAQYKQNTLNTARNGFKPQLQFQLPQAAII